MTSVDVPVSAELSAGVPEPLWLQAAAVIARDIAEGRLTTGSRLPPERELCQRLQISRVTLRRALAKLVDDRLLTASHGRGWYVGEPVPAPRRDWPNALESFTETAARLGLTASSRVLRAELAPASLDEAEELGVVPGMSLFRLDRIRLLEQVPIATDSTRVPAALVPGIADIDFSRRSLYDVLAEAGHAPSRADTTIEAREADADLALRLDIAAGTPILVMHELVHDRDDRQPD